jgi:hypothetical protein
MIEDAGRGRAYKRQVLCKGMQRLAVASASPSVPLGSELIHE